MPPTTLTKLLYLLVINRAITVSLCLKKIGVQIFSRRPPDDRMETQDVLTLLEKYPLALLLYLEFLIHDLNSEVGTAAAT